MANARRWTHADLMTLTDGAGRVSLDWIQRRVGRPRDWPNAPAVRSRRAIYGQFRRIHGLGGLTRGSSTLGRALNATGYGRSHFLRARNALHQQWRRLTPRGAWIITEDQVYDIVQWLRSDHWSKAKKIPGCLWCSTTSKPMCALGLCRRDYRRYRRMCLGFGLPAAPGAQVELAVAAGVSLERLELGLVLAVGDLRKIASGGSCDVVG